MNSPITRKTPMNRPFVTGMLLAVTFVGPGCQNMTPEQKEGATIFGIGGAAAAAAVALIFGGKNRVAIAAGAALVGGTVGVLAGNAIGKHVAEKKAKAKSEQEFLEKQIAEARETHQQAVTLNAQLSQQIETLRAKQASSATQVAIAAKQISEEQHVNGAVDGLNNQISIQQESLRQTSDGSAGRTDLQQQIADLEAERDQLIQNRDALLALQKPH